MALFAVLSMACAKNISAEEINESNLKEEQVVSVCEKMKGEGIEWYDEVHRFLSVQFCEPSVWFDSFFSDQRIDEDGHIYLI